MERAPDPSSEREPERPLPGTERWREWLDHQYTEGYYTQGRVAPFYGGQRPNPIGWVLVATGVLAAAYALGALWSVGAAIAQPGDVLAQAVIAAVLAALQIASGVAFLRPPKAPRGSRRARDQ